MDLSCSIHTYYIIGIDRFKGLNNYHLARIQTAISYPQSRRLSIIQDPDVYQLFGITIFLHLLDFKMLVIVSHMVSTKTRC